MELIPPAGFYFTTPGMAVPELPHLLTALDGELLGKVADLTKCRLGLWPLPAPYDEDDRFDTTRATAPLSNWRLELNQGEILAFSPFIQETVFGVKCLFLDAATEEAPLTRLMATPGHKLPTGAWVTLGYQETPGLAELLESCGWVLIPVGPERGKALFVTRPDAANQVANLAGWCERNGRSRGLFTRTPRGVELREQPASDENRARAVARQLDVFLGRYETYFGAPDETLAAAVAERIRARRELQEQISRARGERPVEEL